MHELKPMSEPRQTLRTPSDESGQWIKDQLGMQKKVFKMFIKKLTSMTNASDTQHVALEEQVAIFLYIIVTNLSIRKVAECFQ